MITCDVSVWIDSERVVPRQNRAEWLERNGIPEKTLEFLARAPASMWEAAGCHLTVTGEVKRLSREVQDALCEPARKLVRVAYKEKRIPDVEVAGALGKATKARKLAMEQQARHQKDVENARARVEDWAEGNSVFRNMLEHGADIRSNVLKRVVEDTIAYLDLGPVKQTNDHRMFTTRSAPSDRAKEIWEAISEAIGSVPMETLPPFVRRSIMEVSRMSLGNHFMTVVPVKFEIPGVDPIICAWSAEN